MPEENQMHHKHYLWLLDLAKLANNKRASGTHHAAKENFLWTTSQTSFTGCFPSTIHACHLGENFPKYWCERGALKGVNPTSTFREKQDLEFSRLLWRCGAAQGAARVRSISPLYFSTFGTMAAQPFKGL